MSSQPATTQSNSLAQIKRLKFIPPYAFFGSLTAIYLSVYLNDYILRIQSIMGISFIVIGAALDCYTLYFHYRYHPNFKLFSDTLITTGPYSFSRSPIHLGTASILIGICLYHMTFISVLTCGIYIITVNCTIIPEHLSQLALNTQNNKEQLQAYFSRVGNWVWLLH